VVLSIMTFVFIFIWFIYGWVIASSKKGSECGEKEDTKGWYIFLLVILIFFTVIFSILICLLLCLCCCLCFLSGAEGSDNRLRSGQINQVISSLSRVPYNENEHENDCAICMCPFDKDSAITQLKCNPQHYFHDECIERWVKEGNNSCPHCRAPIDDVDRIRAMMEGGEWEFSEEFKKSEKKS
jgi:hypothetical protein